jgi:hypothetical protein
MDREVAPIDPGGGGRELARGGARHAPARNAGLHAPWRDRDRAPRARLLVRGPVDLAVLERVLASLSR